MHAIIIIEYIVALLIGSYSIGLLVVWIYELKKNALYTEMQKRIKLLESLHLNAALRYAKRYKIMEDYRRSTEMLERVQKFILENVLFIARRNGSIKNIFHT